MSIPIIISIIVLLGGVTALLFFMNANRSSGSNSAALEFRNGNFNNAIKLCSNLLKKDKHNVIAHFYLGKSYTKKRQFIKAYDSFNTILNNGLVNDQVTDKLVYANLATLATKLGYHDDAVRFNTFLLETGASDRDKVYFNLGVSYYETKNYRDAVKYFEKSYAENQNRSDIYLYLANSLYNIKGFEKALRFYLLADKSGIKNTEMTYRMGQIYFYKKEYKKAKTFFTENLQSDADNSKCLHKLGIISAELDDLKSAKDFFDRALSGMKVTNKNLNEVNDLKYEMANLFIKFGETSKALSVWSEINKSNPIYKDVSIKLPAYLYLDDMQRKGELTKVYSLSKSDYTDLCEGILKKIKHFSITSEVISDKIVICHSMVRSRADEYDCLSCFNRDMLPITENAIEEMAIKLREEKFYSGKYFTWYKFNEISDELQRSMPVDFYDGAAIAKIIHKKS